VIWWWNKAVMEIRDVAAGKDVCGWEGAGSLNAVEKENLV
jgi:hypothetical protein